MGGCAPCRFARFYLATTFNWLDFLLLHLLFLCTLLRTTILCILVRLVRVTTFFFLLLSILNNLHRYAPGYWQPLTSTSSTALLVGRPQSSNNDQ